MEGHLVSTSQQFHSEIPLPPAVPSFLELVATAGAHQNETLAIAAPQPPTSMLPAVRSTAVERHTPAPPPAVPATAPPVAMHAAIICPEATPQAEAETPPAAPAATLGATTQAAVMRQAATLPRLASTAVAVSAGLSPLDLPFAPETSDEELAPIATHPRPNIARRVADRAQAALKSHIPDEHRCPTCRRLGQVDSTDRLGNLQLGCERCATIWAAPDRRG